MNSILIADTTREERQQIVEESLASMGADCDSCNGGLADMYQDYIDGKKEIREINMEYRAHYLKADLEKPERSGCGIGMY